MKTQVPCQAKGCNNQCSGHFCKDHQPFSGPRPAGERAFLRTYRSHTRNEPSLTAWLIKTEMARRSRP